MLSSVKLSSISTSDLIGFIGDVCADELSDGDEPDEDRLVDAKPPDDDDDDVKLIVDG